MLDKLKNFEFAMLTVLCDSWLIFPSFIKSLPSNGFAVIGMLSEKEIKYKPMNSTEITVQNEVNKIKTAIKQRERFGSITKSITIYIEQEDGRKISCKIVFVRNWRNDISSVNKPYIAIITTRLALSDDELHQAYRKRWKIEQGFRILKSWFGLISGNNSQLCETNVALVALTHIRYALLVACREIHHTDKNLNQVRKIFVQEATYQNIITDVASDIKNTAKKVKTAVKKADNLLQDATCEIVSSTSLSNENKVSLCNLLIKAIQKHFVVLSNAMTYALMSELDSNSPAVVMLRNIILRQNITLYG